MLFLEDAACVQNPSCITVGQSCEKNLPQLPSNVPACIAVGCTAAAGRVDGWASCISFCPGNYEASILSLQVAFCAHVLRAFLGGDIFIRQLKTR